MSPTSEFPSQGSLKHQFSDFSQLIAPKREPRACLAGEEVCVCEREEDGCGTSSVARMERLSSRSVIICMRAQLRICPPPCRKIWGASSRGHSGMHAWHRGSPGRDVCRNRVPERRRRHPLCALSSHNGPSLCVCDGARSGVRYPYPPPSDLFDAARACARPPPAAPARDVHAPVMKRHISGFADWYRGRRIALQLRA